MERTPSARASLLKMLVKVLDMVMMGVMMVSTGEGWGVDRSNGRTYILGSADNQDPSGNIDKKSGTISLGVRGYIISGYIVI